MVTVSDLSNVGTPHPMAVNAYDIGQPEIILPTPPGVGVVVALPADDTIRGGAFVALSTGTLLTAVEDTLTAADATTWLDITSGGTISYGTLGATFSTGLSALSRVGLETAVDYSYFDAQVSVTVLHPPVDVGSIVDLGVLEVETGLGDVVRVRLQRGRTTTPSQLVVISEVVVDGVVVARGTMVSAGATTTLQIVRDGAEFYALVDGIQVLRWSGADEVAGPIRLYIDNQTYSGRVSARFSDFSLTGHATIDGQLVEDKEASTRALFGVVPATSLDRRGLRDVVVFGPFGEFRRVDGFEYTLPPPKTVGREPTQLLTTYVDPQLRDGGD